MKKRPQFVIMDRILVTAARDIDAHSMIHVRISIANRNNSH